MSGSPSLAGIFTQKIVVSVGDLAVSNNPAVTLSTYALGSCIGLIAYEPELKVGGLLHFMLPDSTISPEKAAKQPAMFADTGIDSMLQSLEGLRARPEKLRFYYAGGASVITQTEVFDIGTRNQKAITEIAQARGLRVIGRDIGGVNNRTLHFNLEDGTLRIKMPNSDTTLKIR